MERVSFDKDIDVELLANDFAYYPDWLYGPESGWNEADLYSLRLMRHDFGYWIILRQHAGGENHMINMGSSNNAKEIIAVRDALKKLW